MAEKEIRSFQVEFHSCPEKKSICGRAIPFDVKSPNREGFRECIKPEAVEGVLEKSDIFLLYNHNRSNGFLARSKKGKGSMKVEVKEDGVYFEFTPKSDNLSRYVAERIADGEINETSWAFTVAEEEWKKCEDGVYDRTITKFEEIYDFSVVDQSYYGVENAVGCKRFAEIQEEDRKALEAAKKAEEEKRQAEEEAKKAEEIKAYYENLRKENEKYLND